MEKRKSVEKGSVTSFQWPMAAQDEELFYDGVHIKWVSVAELPAEAQGDGETLQSLVRDKVIEIRGDGLLREVRFNPNPDIWTVPKKALTPDEEAALRREVEEEQRQIEQNETFYADFRSSIADAPGSTLEGKAVALMLSEIARISGTNSVAINSEPAGRPSTTCLLCGLLPPEPIWQRVSLNELSRMVCATCAGGTILEHEQAQILGIRVGLKIVAGEKGPKPPISQRGPRLPPSR